MDSYDFVYKTKKGLCKIVYFLCSLLLDTFPSIDLWIQFAFVFWDQVLKENNKPHSNDLGKEVS